MDWVYEKPFTKKESQSYNFIKSHLGNKLAYQTIKLLSLYVFLKKNKFSSYTALKNSVFFDKEKTIPVFNSETAKKILKEISLKGGSDYPFTDFLTKKGIGYVEGILPDAITYPMNNIIQLVQTPISTVKENIPLLDLGLSSLHGFTETGVTTAGDIAEGVGGPVGAAVVLPFVGIAAAIMSTVSILENDLGQAVLHLTNAIPIIGSALSKGITKIEDGVKRLKTHPDIASLIPFVTEYVSQSPVGGNRFSSLKNKQIKWKTRRQGSSETRRETRRRIL